MIPGLDFGAPEDTRPIHLDLFCGRGGWTKGFLDAGYRSIGFDIDDMSRWYPGEFVRGDVRDYNWRAWQGKVRVVTASPPCTEFSTLTHLAHLRGYRGPRDPEKGMVLVRAAFAAAKAVEPMYYVVENVKSSRKYIEAEFGPPTFNNSAWLLWGNAPGFLMPKSNRIYKLAIAGAGRAFYDRKGRYHINRRKMEGYGKSGSAIRSLIPYPIARGLADVCLPGNYTTEERLAAVARVDRGEDIDWSPRP